MAWLRLYDGILDDPKIQMLSDRAFRMLINLWCLAKRGGGFISDDLGALSFSLRQPVGRVRDTIQTLIDARLIDRCERGYEPHDWDEHQFASDGNDKTSTERVRRYRERNPTRKPRKEKHDETVSGNANDTDETKCNALRNGCATELEPDSEPDSEPEPDDEEDARARTLLARVCEILRLDLQANPDRITWFRQVSEMLRDGLEEPEIIAATEVCRTHGKVNLAYIRAIALNPKPQGNGPGNDIGRRESAHDKGTRAALEFIEASEACDRSGNRNGTGKIGGAFPSEGHDAGQMAPTVPRLLRGTEG